ncbi:MAG: GMC family oxidoreductase [Microcoleaceae cyanobacterium]
MNTQNQTINCEIAVIGSGPGGAITACLLAEAGRDVLLIEEGDFLPLESCAPFSKQEMVQKYRNGGLTAAFGKPKIQYVEGRCVGGGSEINSGLYHRTPIEILEKWQTEFEVDALTETDLKPHFEACEKAVHVCNLPGKPPAASMKLYQGAMQLGWNAVEVPRWFRYDTVIDVNKTPKGTRQSMTKTFIPRALNAGCKLLENTKINRLKKQSKKWVLLGKLETKYPVKIIAETVFICCGAIQTPALLRRSGIEQNIGNSLQMHPTVKVIAKFPEVVNSIDMGVPVHQVKQFAKYSFGCSISSPPYLTVGMNDYPQDSAEVHKNWQKMAIYYAMITGEGKGSIRCIPGYQDPIVRYRLTQQDLTYLSRSLNQLCSLLLEVNAEALYPSISKFKKIAKRQNLSNIPQTLSKNNTNLMTVHIFSSCPMGENLQKCAVNSFGKIHNFDNLYINDASLLCTAPGVNPQGSIMAIARRNVLQFLGKL